MATKFRYMYWILIFILSLDIVNAVCIGKLYYLLLEDCILHDNIKDIFFVCAFMTGLTMFIASSILMIKIYKCIKQPVKLIEDINL